MVSRITGLWAVLGLILFASLIVPQVIFGRDRAPREQRVERQYIVVIKDSVADVDTAESELIARVGGEQLGSYRSAIRGFAARFDDERLAEIESDPRVEFASQDRVVSIMDSDVRSSSHRTRGSKPPPPPPPTPSPTPPPSESAAPSTQAVSTQALPTGIDRINAEGKANKGAGVHVAVIDTGIQTSHPDLKDNIAGGKNCSTGTSYNDGNGHGTHVAGTIAARDNGLGVVGVAPEAKLWAVRVLNNSGGGTWSTVICGIDFVTSKAPANGGPITVANLSLGGGGISDNNCGNSNNDALHRAICRARDAGVTVVVAAGNSGANAAGAVPAAYDDAVITVSALVDTDGQPFGLGASTGYGTDDTFASFSNWGTPVDIGAPGVNIRSTWTKSGYNTISGTSMATPHVAGGAALYIATHPGALWSEVKNALISAGEVSGAGHSDPSTRHPENVLRVDTL
ncbi:S8 family serine peptidase [Candidatus Uhrbacteria bacterium]|nr:S8 family serine peptidase [Candidatus Uhrbacteria bacterium]